MSKIIAYHGSPKDFDEFDLKYVGTQNDPGDYGVGFYFDTNKLSANAYGRVGYVYTCEIHFKKYYYINFKAYSDYKHEQNKLGNRNTISNEIKKYVEVLNKGGLKVDGTLNNFLSISRKYKPINITKAFVKQKYDGIIIDYGKDKEILVFNTNSIIILKKDKVILNMFKITANEKQFLLSRRKALANKWYEFKKTVTLYHGTSSFIYQSIINDGYIFPPQKELKDFVEDLLYDYLPEDWITEELKEKAIKQVSWLRKQNEKEKTYKQIYLSSNFNDASGYAKAYHKIGGEIASYIFYKVIEPEFEKHKQRVNPKWSSTKPVVLEVNIPSKLMKTWSDIKKKYERALDTYERLKDSEGFKNFDEFINDKSWGVGFEVMVEVPIPVKNIKKVHYV